MEYKIVLEPDVEDGGYVVHCPALAGCYSQGDTKEEATENIRDAIETYLESLEKAARRAGAPSSWLKFDPTEIEAATSVPASSEP